MAWASTQHRILAFLGFAAVLPGCLVQVQPMGPLATANVSATIIQTPPEEQDSPHYGSDLPFPSEAKLTALILLKEAPKSGAILGYRRGGLPQFESSKTDSRGFAYFIGPSIPDKYQVVYSESGNGTNLDANSEDQFDQFSWVVSDYVLGPTKNLSEPQIKLDLSWNANPSPAVGETVRGKTAAFSFNPYKYPGKVEYGLHILQANGYIHFASSSASPIIVDVAGLNPHNNPTFKLEDLRYTIFVRSKNGLEDGIRFIPFNWLR